MWRLVITHMICEVKMYLKVTMSMSVDPHHKTNPEGDERCRLRGGCWSENPRSSPPTLQKNKPRPR